jgi:F-type H+-transporting ATPase subunit delta
MSVAKTYAKALYETLHDGKSGATFEQIDEQLGSFAASMDQSKDGRVAFYGPMVPPKQKAALMDALSAKAGYAPLVSRFLSLLAKKNRLGEIKAIRLAFQGARLEAEGGILGHVEAADPIDKADIDALAKAFGKKLGKRVEFQVSTDPSLLAGMKVTVNGVTYDGTLRSQLRRLRDQLTLAQH